MSLFKKRHPSKATKEQLGQVLIQGGKITPEQLEQALEAHKEKGGRLGEAMISLGFVTEEDIVQALAIQHNFPYLPLENYEIDTELKNIIPESLSRQHHVLPVDKMGDILTVVMADPLDEEAIEEIEKAAKCKIEIFVGTYTEINAIIERLYKQNKTAPNEENKNG